MKHNNIFSDFIKRTAVLLSVMFVTAATAWAETVTLTNETGQVTLHNGDVVTGTGGRSTHIIIEIGITSPVMLWQDNNTVLYLGTNNKLYWPTTFMNIKSCRAYFQLKGITAGNVSETRIFFGDSDSEDGINSLTPNPSPVGEGSIYNLSGQKLSKPQKGINIVNGKKVLF